MGAFNYIFQEKKLAALLLFLICFSKTLSSSIIAVEGMSGAGKSSSIVNLYPTLSNYFCVLPELNPDPDPDFINKSSEAQVEDFYQLWARRMEIVKQSNIDFLFDRSYFGCLAYTYAMDKLASTNLYLPLKEKIQMHFDIQEDFSKIIVLDVDPELSIERRKKGGMDNYWPWNNLTFLKHFREFYISELPRLTTAQIEYIYTADVSKSELKIMLLNKLNIPDTKETAPFSHEESSLLVNYFKANSLGRFCSDPIILFGCLSIITETHCLQLDKSNNPVLLDNNRLSHFLKHFSEN